MQGVARTGILLVNEFSGEKDMAADFAAFIEKEEVDALHAMTGHISTVSERFLKKVNSSLYFSPYVVKRV